MKKIDLKKIDYIKFFLMVFLITSPIFDTVFFYSRVTTLVRVIIILLFLFATLITKKDSRKNFKYLLVYYFLVAVYLAINYIRSKNFHSLVPGDFDYSLLKESLTILKLCMPITLIYVLKYQKLSKKEYFTIINSWVILVAGSIIILNITKLSLSSYADETIKYNIFYWSKDIDYRLTASKGYFMYANQAAVILLMLLLASVYEFLCINKKYILNILTLLFAMLMLGTRVSTVGGLLTLVCSFFAFIIISIFRKEKLTFKPLILLIPIFIWISLIPVSPFASRNMELSPNKEPNYKITLEKKNSNLQEDSEQVLESDTNKKVTNSEIEKNGQVEHKTQSNKLSKEEKIQYVYEHYSPDHTPSIFFEEYYPIKYDTDFWYNLMKHTEPTNINYRYAESHIINRVIEINNNKYDRLFGISNTRIQNIVNLERDFQLHYYAFGIIGSLILLLIYILISIKSLLNFLKKRTYFNFIILTSVVLFIFTAYLTGNIINSLGPNILFALISGSLIIENDIKRT